MTIVTSAMAQARPLKKNRAQFATVFCECPLTRYPRFSVKINTMLVLQVSKISVVLQRIGSQADHPTGLGQTKGRNASRALCSILAGATGVQV